MAELLHLIAGLEEINGVMKNKLIDEAIEYLKKDLPQEMQETKNHHICSAGCNCQGQNNGKYQ